MALERGELVVRDAGKGRPPRVQIRIDTTTFNPARGEVSQSVLDHLAELAGKEVECELIGGQPKKIREIGGTFVPPRTTIAERGRDRGQAGRGGGSQPGLPQSRQDRREDMPRPQPDFHNPYNFVPAPPRNTTDPDLGDQRPVDQDAFLADRYSGSIRVRMTAVTPLLVPDTERAQESPNGHKTFPLRVDADGKPLIPASSVRGMLRSAYEAVTNSRFGRFSREQHGDRLAFRMDAREGLRLIPARVENGQIHLLTGTSSIANDGSPEGPMYAAWLPRYHNGQVANGAVRYADGSLPAHGDEVHCWLELIQHHRWKWTDRRGDDRSQWSGEHVADFQYWRVRQVVRAGQPLGGAPAATPRRDPQRERAWHEPTGEPLKQVRGWVCITNANINRKHDERVFFCVATGATGAPSSFTVTDDHRRLWQELIQNYQSIHVEDLRRRRARQERPDEYLGPEPGQTAWSRHVYTEADRELRDGTLCYVRLNADRSNVEALFPVMIARELYRISPWDLLHDSLRPAAAIDQLSPADRVFGWVKVDAETGSRSNGERVAARGLLRVGPVRCKSTVENAVEGFAEPGLPLAILSAPKPQQGRFYVARSANGEAQSDSLSKRDAGYAPGKGLRGRKVYPHHRSLPDGHWQNPTEDRRQRPIGSPPHYQEYRRPRKNGQEQLDDQNRSILGWVKPGAQFELDIHVQNLSAVELGALLWLLELPKDYFFRFGGGKPLGFGSVRLEVASLDVRTGADLRSRYDAWLDATQPSNPRTGVVNAFKDAVVRAYPADVQQRRDRHRSRGFEDVPFIRAFLTACRGYGDNLPIHYPRATANGQPGPPSPDGESFKWFVANEREGARHALRDLASDAGLPTLPERAGGGGGGRQRQGPGRRRAPGVGGRGGP